MFEGKIQGKQGKEGGLAYVKDTRMIGGEP